jgi:hypothetical protein
MNPSVPDIGLNSKGIALTINGKRPVIVDYVDKQTGFYFVRDLEYNTQHRVFRLDFMQHQSIPSKHREHHFQSVAHIWAEALKNFPANTVVKSGKLSHETLCRKLREGREAKNKYGWKNPLIDEALWAERAEQISVEPFSDYVLMGGKDKKAQDAKGVPVDMAPENHSRPVIHVTAEMESVERICKLMNDKVFHPRPIVILHQITSSQVQSLEERYDLAINQTVDEGTYEIL